jgi:hypothetical protein
MFYAPPAALPGAKLLKSLPNTLAFIHDIK